MNMWWIMVIIINRNTNTKNILITGIIITSLILKAKLYLYYTQISLENIGQIKRAKQFNFSKTPKI